MKNKYYLYASIFAIIQIIAIIRNYTSDYFNFFWFCDFVPFLFCIAFLLKQDQAVKGLVNIGLFPQIIYFVMMIYSTAQGNPPPGMSNPVGIWYIISSFVIHFSTIIALIATYKVKPHYQSLLYSLLSLGIIFLVTLIKTAPEESVNYVYQTGGLVLPFLIPHYTLFWIPIVFVVFVLPTHLLQHLMYQQSKNKKH